MRPNQFNLISMFFWRLIWFDFLYIRYHGCVVELVDLFLYKELLFLTNYIYL